MRVIRYVYPIKIIYDEDPPIGLKLEDLQRMMFSNKNDMKNHSEDIVNDMKKLKFTLNEKK